MSRIRTYLTTARSLRLAIGLIVTVLLAALLAFALRSVV